jgi:hypothetical protein
MKNTAHMCACFLHLPCRVSASVCRTTRTHMWWWSRYFLLLSLGGAEEDHKKAGTRTVSVLVYLSNTRLRKGITIPTSHVWCCVCRHEFIFTTSTHLRLLHRVKPWKNPLFTTRYGAPSTISVGSLCQKGTHQAIRMKCRMNTTCRTKLHLYIM